VRELAAMCMRRASGLADFGVGNATALTRKSSRRVVRTSCLPSCLKHKLRNKGVVTLKELEDEEFVSLQLRRACAANRWHCPCNGISLKHMTVRRAIMERFRFRCRRCWRGNCSLPRATEASTIIRCRQKLVPPSIVRRIGILRLKSRPLTPAATGFRGYFPPAVFKRFSR